MANRRPDKLDADFLRDPFRMAEIAVWQACAALPTEWIALYGVGWAELRSGAPILEGEADFVITGPGLGLVVIEVKGGRVGYDEAGWLSIDRKGGLHRIKDPVLQARTCKHQFLRMLHQTRRFSSMRIPAAHMACFPDVVAGRLPSLPDIPDGMLLGSDFAGRFEDSIRNAATRSNSRDELDAFSDRDADELANALRPHFDAPDRWSTVGCVQRAVMDALTDEQSAILQAVSANRRIGLTGPAGCGKTVVALCRARDLLAAGKRVLIIVPAGGLKSHYLSALPTGADLLVLGEPWESEEAAPVDRAAWDQIIVDEAQDFPIEIWETIEACMARLPSSQLLAVYDSNQALHKRSDFYLPDGLAEIHLSKIVRNTKPIAEMSMRFLRDRPYRAEAAGPDGVGIQEIEVDEEDGVGPAVGKFIAAMVKNHGFDYRDVVVLWAKSGGRSLRAEAPSSHEFSEQVKPKSYSGIVFRSLGETWAAASKNAVVACGNVTGFRGLEAQVVVLADLDDATDRDLIEACYTGASRARNILAFVARPDTLARIRSSTLSVDDNSAAGRR